MLKTPQPTLRAGWDELLDIFKRKEALLYVLWFSHSVVSDSLQPHGQQLTGLPCPSPSPGACSHPCPHQVGGAIQTLLLCHPLFLLPSVFPSIRVFSNELALCNRWSKYWNFSFSISPSSENLGLIFFRIDWFALLAVQGTLKNTFRKHQFFGG